MLLLIYALKKHNNWRFPTPAQPRISFERAIEFGASAKFLETSNSAKSEFYLDVVSFSEKIGNNFALGS
jgi:hypothetical protein